MPGARTGRYTYGSGLKTQRAFGEVILGDCIGGYIMGSYSNTKDVILATNKRAVTEDAVYAHHI